MCVYVVEWVKICFTPRTNKDTLFHQVHETRNVCVCTWVRVRVCVRVCTSVHDHVHICARDGWVELGDRRRKDAHWSHATLMDSIQRLNEPFPLLCPEKQTSNQSLFEPMSWRTLTAFPPPLAPFFQSIPRQSHPDFSNHLSTAHQLPLPPSHPHSTYSSSSSSQFHPPPPSHPSLRPFHLRPYFANFLRPINGDLALAQKVEVVLSKACRPCKKSIATAVQCWSLH